MLPAGSLSENYRGILYVVAACCCLILNDTCVKLASETASIPQIIVFRSLIALPLVVPISLRQGALRNVFAIRDRFLWLRTLGEVGANATFLSALARLEIANISAIAQTTPLAVTAAAALFLGENVGIRRWLAILIGFLAVLLVIRPGMEGFNAWSLLALCSVGFIVLRDLSSRAMALSIHPLMVAVISLAMLVPLGIAMSPLEPWREITLGVWTLCVGSAVAISAAYVLLVNAMRHGEVSVVAPFRYTFLVWAILLQVAVFSVWPDSLTLVGSAILVATGLYTVYWERAGAKKRAPSAITDPVPASQSA